jgi:SAM-dependent methyltransferase
LAVAGFKQALVKPLKLALGLLPASLAELLIVALARSVTRRLPPAESLRFLLRLDNALYEATGQVGVAYEGGGGHPRHRLIPYHDFFVSRLAPGQRVLDVGCNTGLLARAMAEGAGARVTGVDLEAGLIATARRDNPHPLVEYLVGDALTDLPQGEFEVIVLSNLLEHLPQRVAFLRDLLESHRPQRLLIRLPLFERDWRVPLKRELGVEWRLDRTHHTEYTLESFAAEMAQAGLEVVYMEARWGEIWAEARPAAPARPGP